MSVNIHLSKVAVKVEIVVLALKSSLYSYITQPILALRRQHREVTYLHGSVCIINVAAL